MKYILCDMDGTLLDEKKEYSPYLNEVIEQIVAKGVSFGVASGRQYYNLRKNFPKFQDNMIFICENGSIMFHGDKPLFADEIPYDKLHLPIVKMRKAKDVFPVLCGVRGAYIEHTDEEFVKNCHMYYERLEIVDDILEAAKKDCICKISIYDKIDTEINAFPFMEEDIHALHMVVSGKHWVDITNPGVSKGKAIQYLKQKHSLQSEDFVAFGDYLNDYEMMKECTYSYAMGNAHPQLKEICNFEALSNEDDGVVKAICDLYDIRYPGN